MMAQQACCFSVKPVNSLNHVDKEKETEPLKLSNVNESAEVVT
jgi:hypothetical protein